MKPIKVTQKDVLYLSISFFVIVVLWVGFNLYHTSVTTTIEKDVQMQIVPIHDKFDTAIIEKLKTRQKVSPLFESTIPQEASPEATISPTIEEEITPSPTTVVSDLSPTPTPTESVQSPDQSFIEEEPTTP